MVDRESSRLKRLSGAGALLFAVCVSVALGGCAAASSSSAGQPGAQRVGTASCSLRAMVNIRQGASIRNGSDLVEAARRLSVNLSVLQSMGSNSMMIVIRENGPQGACEESLSELRNDLRIESVERF